MLSVVRDEPKSNDAQFTEIKPTTAANFTFRGWRKLSVGVPASKWPKRWLTDDQNCCWRRHVGPQRTKRTMFRPNNSSNHEDKNQEINDFNTRCQNQTCSMKAPLCCFWWLNYGGRFGPKITALCLQAERPCVTHSSAFSLKLAKCSVLNLCWLSESFLSLCWLPWQQISDKKSLS